MSTDPLPGGTLAGHDTLSAAVPIRPRSGRFRGEWRSIALQAAAILVCLGLTAYVASNVIANLRRLGVTTGFHFLQRPAGFDIAQSLIDFHERSTYLAAFVVALLNTVILTAVCIVAATVLGFAIGLARLSSNRLVSGVATIYVEMVRNIPLLLQIFFWYFSVLRTLPSPRESVDLGGLAFLNVRGFYLPKPLFEEGFGYVLWALLLAVVLSWGLSRWARRRQALTGRIFPFWRTTAGLVILLPAVTFLEAAVTLTLIMIGVTMFLALYRLVRGPSLPDRVVAIDLIGTATVGAIAAYDILTEQPVLLDAATVVTLVAFLGTVAFARYVQQRGNRG